MTPEKMLYAELNMFCIVILLILAHKLRRVDKSIEQSYLIRLLIGLSTLFLFDVLWAIIDSNPFYSYYVNYAVNILYFTTSTTCAYYCLCYLHLSLFAREFTKGIDALLKIPIWITAGLCTASIWTGWVFTVSPDNVYRRGPLYVIQFLIPLLYMTGDSLASLYFGVKSKQSRIRTKAWSLAGIMILPVIGSITEVVLPDVTVICVFVTFSMISVIFDFQQQQITRDSLTLLPNRYALMQHLEERLSRNKKQQVYVIFADVDYFKSINDNFGHLEGDHALCYVANALRAAARSNDAFPARISGDEFVVVFSADTKLQAEKFRQSLKDAVLHASRNLPYSLIISAGMTCSEDADRENISALLDRADAELYKEKKQRKAKEKGMIVENAAS